MMIGELIMYNTLLVPVFLLASGILLAFWGSRIVPFALVVSALILGLLRGGSVLVLVSNNPDLLKFGPPLLGILLAVLVSFLYRIAFFLAGFFIGYFVCSSLFPDLNTVIFWGISFVSGALVYVSRNFVFSVLTSIMGAGLAATGAVNLIAWVGISAGIFIYWIIVGIVSVTGLVYQTKRNKGRK